MDVPDEGTFEFSASAVSKNGDLTASGSLPSDQNKTLAVDRSPMILAYALPTRFSLTDDREIVFLNGNSAAQNQPLRSQHGINCYSATEFIVAANVSDATGLSVDSGTRAAKLTGPASPTLAITVTPPAEAGAPEQIVLAAPPGNLLESIAMASGPGQLGALQYRGRYALALKLTDKAGNGLVAAQPSDFVEQFKLWVDRTPVEARSAKLRLGEVNIESTVDDKTQLSNAHFFQSTFDAVLRSVLIREF